MNKRVLDGKGIWRSDKIARIDPPWVKPEYANVLPLATANGTFEFSPRKVWSDCYSYNRPEIDCDQVRDVILPSIHSVGLLFTWEQDDKVWAFFTGIDKPGSGRLPPPSRIHKGHEIVGPDPPTKQVQEYLEAVRRNGGRLASQWLPNGCLGFGSGSGSGLGSGKNLLSQEKASCDQKDSSKKAKKETKDPQYSEAARRLAQLLLVRVAENLKRLNAKSKLLGSDKEQHAGVKRWTPDIELMLRLDGYSEAEVRELIEWAQADSFWWKNIRSGRKLREQAEELSIRMKGEQSKKTVAGRSPKPLDEQFKEVERRRAGQGVN